ncbi:MAG: hypothetical protein V1897_02285 [Pseudomonadota bacterium]
MKWIITIETQDDTLRMPYLLYNLWFANRMNLAEEFQSGKVLGSVTYLDGQLDCNGHDMNDVAYDFKIEVKPEKGK